MRGTPASTSTDAKRSTNLATSSVTSQTLQASELSRFRVRCEACPRSPSPASSRPSAPRARWTGSTSSVADGRGARLPRAQRRRQVDHDPRAARPAARRRGTARLLGGDPWREATALHRRLAYVPGDVTLWPNLVRRRGDRPARPPARRAGRAAPRRAARALRARPDQEGPRVLQGQPPEGRAGRRARLRRRAADPRRADLRPGPADGGGLPRVRRRGARARAAPCCSPATSSPRSRRCATA